MSCLSGIVVSSAVQLQHETQLGTIEIHNESMEDVLTPEFETEDAAVPEQRPCEPLRWSRVPPELPGDEELDGIRVGLAIDPMANHL
jgi:hypothetical protein